MIPDPPHIEQNSEKPQETVVTPAGRVPKDRVKHVKPGQVIHRSPDGTYSVVPEEPPKTSNTPESKDEEGKQR
jgi:hypothetical protein